jgi:hypothetical protein
MSFLQDVENVVETTEADVVAIIAEIKTVGTAAEGKLESALNWVVGNAPTIAADIQTVEGLFEQIVASTPGAAQNAIVTKAIADANLAVAGLNAAATAANSGSTAAAVVAGYIAVQNAIASAAGAKAAVAAIPTAVATPATSPAA